MYCRKCGAQIDDEAYVCVHCGALVKELPQPGIRQAAGNAGYRQKKTNGMAIAGFVCSFLFAILGLIFSLIGMNQCKERGDNGYGLAKAGMIISIVWMTIVFLVSVVR
mgnify:CR=1 FL=1